MKRINLISPSVKFWWIPLVKLVKSIVINKLLITHSMKNGVLDHFLFLQAFFNFWGFYVLYKVDMQQKYNFRLSNEIPYSCTIAVFDGDKLLVDPTEEEEKLSDASVTVVVQVT